MAENPSIDLAIEHVVEKLHEQLDDQWDDVMRGWRVTVEGLEDTDCIPLTVDDRRGGKWDLVSATQFHATKMRATYEAR